MRSYRTLFLSDLHLGTRWCHTEALLGFLGEVTCQQLYLVGDIVDGWKLRRNPCWPQSHNDVIRKLLKLSRRVRTTYITGNHDAFLDAFDGTSFGNILLTKQATHRGADGRRYLVVHGDEFDGVVQAQACLARCGDVAYDLALWLNKGLWAVRRRMGMPYWSLSQYMKGRVKDAVSFMGDYQNALAREARRAGADGVICGHIHSAALMETENLVYANCGDWVESCTALAEHPDGRLEVLSWPFPPEDLPRVTAGGELVLPETPLSQVAPSGVWSEYA